MSVSVIRGLLERNLVERAVTLSETRWSGSGPLVRLAHEWTGLSPTDRRDRLAAIGPEDLARLRGVAELQPDLARVLDDLETRGIIPPAASLVSDGSTTLTREEAVVDAVLDLAEERAVELVEQAEIDMPSSVDAWRERVAPNRGRVTTTPEVMPVPISDAIQEFQDAEADRRAVATERSVEMLDRIRKRVEDSSARIASPAGAEYPGGITVPATVSLSAPVVEASAELIESDASIAGIGRVSEQLLNAVMSERVFEAAAGEPELREDDLRSVAALLGLGFVRIDGDKYTNREVYGGLMRKGRGIVEEAGFLPRALAGCNLVAYSGRLYPTALGRIDDGFFDIPGTRAATRVHPDCRLVILRLSRT